MLLVQLFIYFYVCCFSLFVKYKYQPCQLYTWVLVATNRANWDDATTKTFLDLCIAEKNLMNFNNKGLIKLGWQHIYCNFKQQTGLGYDNKQMQSKLDTLRRSYLQWRDLQNSSGLGRDRSTGGIAAVDSYCVPMEGDTSAGQQDRGKQPLLLEELHLPFGRTTQDRGTLLSAGGAREARPSTESEDTPAVMSQDPIGASSVRVLSKRPTREKIVDSPPKKKSCSLEDYVRDSFETVSQRRLSHEQEELDLAMRILEQDGIQDGSDLYCKAISVLKDARYRGCFMMMKTKEGRLKWIQFVYDNM